MKSLLFVLAILSITSSFAQCEDFNIALAAHDPFCEGIVEGSIAIETIEGESPYSYEITNEDGLITNDPTAHSLPPGDYFIEVVDALGCLVQDTVKFIGPRDLIIEYTVTECTDGCNGMIVIDTINNYYIPDEFIYFLWTPSPDGEYGFDVDTLTGLCADSYFVQLLDGANGCDFSTTITVDCLASLDSELSSAINVIYNGIQSELSFSSTNSMDNLPVQIIDINGKLVLSEIVQGTTYNLPINLTAGLYIYRIWNNQTSMQTGKFHVAN